MADRAKAVVFTQPNKPDLLDLPLGEMAPDRVRLRTIQSGISIGTESWKFSGRRPEDTKFPHVPGYQACALVEEVGRDVKSLKPGDRVVAVQGLWGNPIDAPSGVHASHVVTLASKVTPVPEGCPDEGASLWVMAAVGLHGVNTVSPIATDTVAIYGMGLIGQMTAQVCRARGCIVVGLDISDPRLRLASEHSVDLAVNTNEQDPLEAVRSVAPDGADLVFESTGFAELLDPAIRLCRPFGKFAFQGWYPGDVRFYFHTPHGKQIHAYFPCAWGGDANRDAALRMMARGHIKMTPLVTHRYSEREALSPYEMIIEGRRGEMLGVIIQW
jgi:2-desacetyl-2-hydroxyethyl bacteriochlorophyllide A dehydrogenase